MLIRIPRQKYAYIELDENDLTKKNLGSMIKKALAIIDKYATTDLEVVVDGKKCPKCGKRLLQLIGISEKNNKPYHRIKCEDQACGYIQWIEVSFK